MQLLNETYYKGLLNKFGKSNNELGIEGNNFINLNTTFLEKSLAKSKLNLMLQIPSSYQHKFLLYANLLLRLTVLQFLEAVEKPQFKVDDRVKTLKTIKKKEYRIVSAVCDNFKLQEITRGKLRSSYHGPDIFEVNYSWLRKNCKRITKGTQAKKLLDLEKLFQKLFGIAFIPDEFKSKSIVICRKSIWNNIANTEILNRKLKDFIPLTYITKKGTELPTINIDPALYFVPDYITAFKCILSKGEKIDNILLIDCKCDQLPTMIMDQGEFGFGIIGISTQTFETNGFRIWRWLKEEIDLINTL